MGEDNHHPFFLLSGGVGPFFGFDKVVVEPDLFLSVLPNVWGGALGLWLM